MSTELLMRLVAAVGRTPSGATTSIDIADPGDVDVVQRWCDATGNSVLTASSDAIEVFRGRIPDPIAALPENRRPGYRLWVYTNFHCNLACDYCCVASSPTAAPRVIGIAEFVDIVDQAEPAGVKELYITGGEPFMLIDLDERLRVAAAALPTTVLTNGMLWRGDRLKLLQALPREGLTLQISLDSATETVHDRHRGVGSFARAQAGIRTAIELGFHVRVAATLGEDAGESERELELLFDELGLDADQRLVRRVAHEGVAVTGVAVSRASLIPEVCITEDGVYWHPVAATDISMKVSDAWNPPASVIKAIREEYRDYRIRGDVVASTFPCA